uniref:Charged multivesicular body protein 2A n=1 Tax=Pavo cristatus TaxID=9049 RepID=A0A8C9LGJ7_PAVCR
TEGTLGTMKTPNVHRDTEGFLEIPKVSWGSSQPPNVPFGLQDAVKIMAKDLVRTRRYVKKFITMRANVQAVSLKIQTLKSNNSMAQAMKGVTKAMATMNRQLKLPQIQKIMMEFEKQAEIMDMKEELMNDAIDDAMGDEDDEEESDAVVSQVLDELGLNLTDELSFFPPPEGQLAPCWGSPKGYFSPLFIPLFQAVCFLPHIFFFAPFFWVFDFLLDYLPPSFELFAPFWGYLHSPPGGIAPLSWGG